jgi:tyrosine-specific transport protein
MKTKLLGSVLLIVGTAIGGGMLALPIATSQAGLFYSTLLLFGCWFVMTASAFLILEVNLWLPQNSNMISMAKATLGRGGEIIAWIAYLLLLYSLLAAYIAGGGDFLKNLLSMIHVTAPSWVTSILFAGLLGYIVCLGIRSVDVVNRSLMFIKLAAFVLLVLLIFPHVDSVKLAGGEFHYLTASITVAITSFGFATIVPSLRTYFEGDVKKLHLAILIGSLIPLCCYILWDLAIMGIIPREGDTGLVAMLHSNRSTSDFVNTLSSLLQRDTVTAFARIFTSICLATSFLGVALSLSHFLADGFRLTKEKNLKNDIIIYTATFLPPIIVVLFYPGAFIKALSYAGIYCVILLVLLPALMAWSGRYQKGLAKGYRVIGGKLLLMTLFIISVLIIAYSVIEIFTS